MLRTRLIPVMLIDNAELVKTKRFKAPSYVGDIINAIRIFNEKEVDEIMVIDISASSKGRGINYSLIEEIASECFMPFTYGGGINSLRQVDKILKLGVEKICLHSALFEKPELVSEIAKKYGSQMLTASLDVRKNIFGKYTLWNSSRKSRLKTSILDFVLQIQNLEIGEILLNNIDKEGTLSGPDLDLVSLISKKVRIPLIANGGVASLEDIKNLVKHGADAVAAGAYFVYHGPHRAVLISYPKYNELESLFAE